MSMFRNEHGQRTHSVTATLVTAVAVVLGGGVLLAPTGAGANATAEPSRSWQPRVVLTPDADGNPASGRIGFAMGTAADGTAVAVWERERTDDKVIELSRRAPGGSWSDPLVAATVSKSSWVGDMVVAADGTATFTVSRVRVAPDTYEGFVQTWRPNGQLGTSACHPERDAAGR